MSTDIPLSQVMTPHPRSVQIDQKLSDVRAALADYRVHHLPVVDGQRLVGIISMTDMLEFGFKPRDTHEDLDEYLNEQFSIPQIMQSDVITISSTSNVREAAHILTTGSLHAVPVVDEDDNLVGIVTSTDLVSFLASHL